MFKISDKKGLLKLVLCSHFSSALVEKALYVQSASCTDTVSYTQKSNKKITFSLIFTSVMTTDTNVTKVLHIRYLKSEQRVNLCRPESDRNTLLPQKIMEHVSIQQTIADTHLARLLINQNPL